MIVRALDADHDWTFGRGRNDYKKNRDALAQTLKTRLMCFLGDCFFALNEGVDYFNLLGGKDLLALNLAISSTILNTRDVTSIVELNVIVDRSTRNYSVQYEVSTSYGNIQGDI